MMMEELWCDKLISEEWRVKNEERRGRADSEDICAFQTLLAAQTDNDISLPDDERASDILDDIRTETARRSTGCLYHVLVSPMYGGGQPNSTIFFGNVQ